MTRPIDDSPRYYVARYWSAKWGVYDVLNRDADPLSVHADRADADADCHLMNAAAHAKRHATTNRAAAQRLF